MYVTNMQLVEQLNCTYYLFLRYFNLKDFQMTLTQERAYARGQLFERGTISYDFHVTLEKGQNYSGFAQLTFSLISIPLELPIDFKGKVVSLYLNGEVQEINHQDGFILLDVTKLRFGVNVVGVQYSNTYNNDGSGCVSFVDTDNSQYIYTQFEPYYANRVFPAFDQPDLKATFRLYTITPADWGKVLSNEYAILQKQFTHEDYLSNIKTTLTQGLQIYLKNKSGKLTIFPASKLLPTYLYCFIAGPYQELKLPQNQTYHGIPMSLYCIGSLFEYLKVLAPFVFQVTIQSMDFFQTFFGYKFSFNKYDQVFAHEYKWGAMQNAGIVTFNDRYIFKEKVSTDRMLSFANTISHELAHHWFGNLVTMQWWDDLWLNQSFADFISHFCLQKIKDKITTITYESAMAAFLQRKGWGYHEDQMITTHPIRGKVANTSVADSIFDGITYSKGAATLKQLLFLMGEQNFSLALGEYFHKYEWNNATIEDFLAYMQNHFTITQFTLTQWRQLWLEKESLNVIEVSWKPEDHSANATLIIKQSPYTETHPTLRLHKIKVGLFKQDSSVDTIDVLIRPQAQTVAEYDGSKQYKAILLNFQDQTFAKNVIDPVSLNFFIKNINSIGDLLSRTLIWRSFFEMIKDGKMTSHQFVQVIVGSLVNQTSDTIFEKQFDFVHTAINTYTPQKLRSELNDKVFKFIYELIPKIPKEKENRIVILKSKLTSFAYSNQNINVLINWKSGKDETLKQHKPTVGQEWSIVLKAFSLKNWTNEQKNAFFEVQRAKDPSDTAKNHRFTCDSLLASKEEFQKIYLSFQDPESKHSIEVKHSISSGWNHHYHSQWLAQYRDRYFDDVQKLVSVLSGDHFEIFYDSFAPIDDDLAYQIARYQKIIFPEGKDKHSRDILKIVDNLKRRLNAYKLYEVTAAL